MKPPKSLSRVIGAKRYNTETATLIAHDAYWDGHNWERRGRNQFLYRTPNGTYFLLGNSASGESWWLTVWRKEAAVDIYCNDLPVHEVKFEDAFPGITIIEG